MKIVTQVALILVLVCGCSEQGEESDLISAVYRANEGSLICWDCYFDLGITLTDDDMIEIKDFLKDLDPTNNSTNITKSEKKEVEEKKNKKEDAQLDKLLREEESKRKITSITVEKMWVKNCWNVDIHYNCSKHGQKISRLEYYYKDGTLELIKKNGTKSK